MIRRRGNRKPRRAVRRARKARVPRSLGGPSQNARIVETLEVKPLLANQVYTNVFQIGLFPRASAIAPCFKFYRPAKITWEYTPYYNVFGGAEGAISLPQFLMFMNRTQDNYSTGLSAIDDLKWIESTGARPKSFNKKITISYKPNWLTPGTGAYTITGVGGQTVVNGISQMGARPCFDWCVSPNSVPQAVTPLGTPFNGVPTQSMNMIQPTDLLGNPYPYRTPTSTNNVVYGAHTLMVSQDYPGVSIEDPICDVRCTVVWEFKDPNPKFFLLNSTGVSSDLSGAPVVT